MLSGAARTQQAADECRPEAGGWVPRIDRNRCEGKNDCVIVCPYDVFELRRLTADERNALSLRSKVKLFVHGGKQAFAIRAAECHACGLCVSACPERAITLMKTGTQTTP
jgi:NAD-dependent dihydropyrimidine dehydrogenase PreA subunit